MDSVRCIIASAALRGWKLHQFDAVTAFLHGDVDSSIYMELPEGFEEPGYVYRLRRSLYRLKQAPRIWYQYVHRVLAAHGFTMAESDNCVFYKSDCVAKTTPMNPKQVLNYYPDEAPPDEEAKARFVTAIGSLMYLMVGTRPDIAFALGTLSRFTSQPQSHH
ncbi:hypothetical protein N7455_006984 [Penicillium solitum]|uniref:uncharacterized protein n=1 Tax=Penicillium solitum TaxID=60172 RepID=UPI0032C3E698|nr:hypothetical protein N7455_006984 [Penicillium solitum]